MTIATLMATSAMFLVSGWTAPAFGALAITIGGVVCIASADAGDTSQDLKTGYIIGATPRAQQIALMIGVMVSTMVDWSDAEPDEHRDAGVSCSPQTWDINAPTRGFRFSRTSRVCPNDSREGADDTDDNYHKASEYVVLNAIGSTELQDGKYLYSPTSGQDRGAMDSGNRRGEGSGTTGPADGDGDQRHP